MALANAQPHESRLYYEFSHLYDLLFRRVFYPRIARVIRSLAVEPGARVLELGVGTGLSLDAYPSHCQATGIDRAPAADDRPDHALARLDHAPALGRARSLHAARRAGVEDVAALAVHHRGGAQRQGRAGGALGAARVRPPLVGRARVARS